MNPHDQAWQRLVTAARRAPADPRDTAAPYGFAARVAARAFTSDAPLSFFFERFSWRALGVACLLMAVTVAADYSLINHNNPAEDELPTEDGAVAAVLDLAS
ncbi:MAG: hypothetical protein JSS11_15900 [Verrucomicrobia bacterium]|nr:hypothetical protein [Verrucomicrobiota bacterium]